MEQGTGTTPRKNTKDKIFLASAELFAEKSYSRVSMRDIAKKVGIRPASIYNYYESKEEILNEILHHYTNRIARFYEAYMEKSAQPGYEPKLSDIVYVYEPEEVQLMFWISRVVYVEQFTSIVASDTLVGASSQRYTGGKRLFLNLLADKGIIQNRDNCEMYTELLSRMAHAFQIDFLHPEFEPAVKSLQDMYKFIFRLILSNEGTLDRYDELF